MEYRKTYRIVAGKKKKDLQLDEDFAILHKDLWLRFPQYVHSMGLALGLVSGLADEIKEVGWKNRNYRNPEIIIYLVRRNKAEEKK